jgi:hypothetical protein
MTETASLFPGFSPESRVWIYIANPGLNREQSGKLLEEAKAFTTDWQAHGKGLHADASVLFRNVLLIAADEKLHQASGCSIDKQLHWIQDTEKRYGISLTQRLLIPVFESGEVRVEKAEVNPELQPFTEVVDITLTKLGDVRSSMIKTIEGTWMRKFLQNTASNLHY